MQVRVADAGVREFDEDFAWGWGGDGDVVDELDAEVGTGVDHAGGFAVRGDVQVGSCGGGHCRGGGDNEVCWVVLVAGGFVGL